MIGQDTAYPWIVWSYIMDILKPIKATACNRGKVRIWLSERDLTPYGFEWGTPIKVQFLTDCILITADGFQGLDLSLMDGKATIMNGRKGKNGKDLQLKDMTCTEAQRESIRMGCAKFQVEAEHGRIVISADFSTREAV